MLLKYLKFPKNKIKRRNKRQPLEWVGAPDITRKVASLIFHAGFSYINHKNIYCFRSTGAHTRAIARIWGLGRIWQQALGLEPSYVIEVISEKFDKIEESRQNIVLIHELLHIPTTFSGALVPHKEKGGVNERVVREIYAKIEDKI